MTRTFIQTDEFSRNWDEFGFTDDDLRRLEFDIMMNPHKYPVMQGTGGLRKARFAFKHHGKSGGVRVCYVDFVIEETICLGNNTTFIPLLSLLPNILVTCLPYLCKKLISNCP